MINILICIINCFMSEKNRNKYNIKKMTSRVDVQQRDPSAWPVDVIHCSTDMLAKQNVLECDGHVRFDEGPHLYYVKDSPTPIRMSVTGVVHSLFAPFDAKAVLANMSAEKKMEKYPGQTDADIIKRWDEEGKRAAAAGTRMHAAIEVFFNTYDYFLQTGYLSTDPSLQIEMRLFRAWFTHEFLSRNLVPFRTELIIHGGGTAGSIDMIAKQVHTGEFFILDWKRASKLEVSAKGNFGYATCAAVKQYNLEDVNFVHYSLQLHIYRYMLMQFCSFPPIPVRNLYLVVLHPNSAGYKMAQCHDYSHVVPKIFEHLQQNTLPGPH